MIDAEIVKRAKREIHFLDGMPETRHGTALKTLLQAVVQRLEDEAADDAQVDRHLYWLQRFRRFRESARVLSLAFRELRLERDELMSEYDERSG